MTDHLEIVVMEGDETGQELLEQSLRVLDPSVVGFEVNLHRFDLSLENRRLTNNGVVHEAARAVREVGLGLKAATITPVGDVGSPNRILREEMDAAVIVRTGRPIPGIEPALHIHHPICVVRAAVGDAYGAQEWREGSDLDEVAERTSRITRANCRAVAEYAFATARAMGGCVFGGPKWTVSPTYEGMLKEELDRAAAINHDVVYRPMLIDATYAALVNKPTDMPLVIPALNRDGDCLADLVLPLFGSLASSESLIVGLDEERKPTVLVAEAPHGTAPDLFGMDVANPMAMLLACAAVLQHASSRRIRAVGGAIRVAVMDTVARGVRTADLGGTSSTSHFVDEVIKHLQGA